MFIICFLFLVSPFYFYFFILYGLTHHPPPATCHPLPATRLPATRHPPPAEKSCRNYNANEADEETELQTPLADALRKCLQRQCIPGSLQSTFRLCSSM